jgi:protein-tyrosine-phosphatase
MKVLFVCRGNVGRSQMAEAFFKQITSGNYLSQSAGIEARGSDGKDLDGMLLKDRKSSEHVIESMKEIGIDISNNFIKRLTPEMVENADRIIVLVKPKTIPEFLKSNNKVTYWNITDPDEQTLEFHKQTRDQIKKLVEEFVDNNLKY